MARVSAPGPPLTVTLLPPGAGSTAAFRSSVAPVPADHGPWATPKIPRAATAAWRRSFENHSATRSAAAIGIQRRSRNESVRPSARKRRPVFSSSHSSPTAGTVERRRRRLEQLAEKRAEPLEHGAELRIPGGVGFGERPNGLGSRGDVGRKGERPPVGRERHEPRIRRDELDAPGFEPHVAHDRRPQRPDRVRERRAPKPRRDLVGDGAAADHRPPLEYERLQPGFGQVEGGRQAVVAARRR